MTGRFVDSLGIAVAAMLGAGLIGCAPRCPPADPPASAQRTSPPPPPTIDPDAPLCDSQLAFNIPHATPCRLIGVYAINIYTRGVGKIIDAWPAVFSEGVGWVILESLWYPEKRPASSTTTYYEGKYVEVYGIPHYSVPSPGPENYVHLPCIAPVYAIRVLEGPPGEASPLAAAEPSL